MSTSKNVPERTCIACRRVAPKRELVRIVASPEGVMVDEAGRKKGRGAYICPSAECWEEAVRKDRLAHALRTRLAQADKDNICQYIDKLKGSV